MLVGLQYSDDAYSSTNKNHGTVLGGDVRGRSPVQSSALFFADGGFASHIADCRMISRHLGIETLVFLPKPAHLSTFYFAPAHKTDH